MRERLNSEKDIYRRILMLTKTTLHNVLNHIFRNDSMTSPTTVYVGLHTSGGEVSGGGYTRQTITFNAPSDLGVESATEIKFPISTNSWGKIEKAVIYDAKTAGDSLDEAPIQLPVTVDERQQFTIPEGNYTINFVNGDSKVYGGLDG